VLEPEDIKRKAVSTNIGFIFMTTGDPRFEPETAFETHLSASDFRPQSGIKSSAQKMLQNLPPTKEIAPFQTENPS